MMTGTIEPRWLSDTEQASWRAFLSGGRLLMEALDRGLTPHGVSLAEYEIISMLSESPSRQMRMSELAAIVVQSRSRLTHTATRLEKRGWVSREPCEGDRRGVLLTLTDEGLGVVGRLSAIHVAQVRAALVDRLTPAQFAALGEAMDVVRAGLSADPAAPVRLD